MPGKNIYTLARTAQILGMPEQDVLALIDSGQLPAEFNQGLMSHMIQHDQLLSFMKSRKMFAEMRKIMQSRVLLCDRDQQITFILRAELERGAKAVVKIATTGKEVEMAIDEFLPDVIVMHIAATQRAVDNLASTLRLARERRPTRLIIYHNEPDAIVDALDDVKRVKEYLRVDAMVSVAGGTRKLIQVIEETLGVRRETRTLGPFPGFGSPTKGAPATATPPPGSLPTLPTSPVTPPPNMLPTQAPPPPKKSDTRRKTLLPP